MSESQGKEGRRHVCDALFVDAYNTEFRCDRPFGHPGACQAGDPLSLMFCAHCGTALEMHDYPSECEQVRP